jgi:hypothetical protein
MVSALCQLASLLLGLVRKRFMAKGYDGEKLLTSWSTKAEKEAEGKCSVTLYPSKACPQ